MGFFNSIKNVDELLNKVGYLRQYLRVYDTNEIILFKFKDKGESRVLSNLWGCSEPLPWKGKYYNSVEQMIITSYIEDNCNPKYKEELEVVLDLIYKCKDGQEVKENEKIQRLLNIVRNETIARIGDEKWFLNTWDIKSKAIRIKYDLCREFKNFVDANKDKYFCENSHWQTIPRSGVLKVTDKSSPLFNKYIGANHTGIAIQRCLTL